MHRGYLLIESLAATAVLLIIFTAFLPTLGFFTRQSAVSASNTESTLLLSSGLEATYNVFATHWSTQPLAGQFKLSQDATTTPPSWVLISGSDETNIYAKYTRRISVAEVCRSSTDGTRLAPDADPYNGVCTSGNLDTQTRLATVTISWQDQAAPRQTTSQLLIYKL